MSSGNQLVDASRRSIRAMVELLRDPRGVLYVGTPSFLSGRFWSLSERADDADVWDRFLSFVAKKYNDTEGRSWNALILFHNSNSYDAYRNFFRDFDESLR
jgi:hypothetical protein